MTWKSLGELIIKIPRTLIINENIRNEQKDIQKYRD